MGCNITPYDLRICSTDSPIGIGTETPFFSWKISSGLRSQTQTAYRIVTAEESAATNGPAEILWDTGKVISAETLYIPYAGVQLKSDSAYSWKVMVWDKENNPSEWSRPARFETGLLHESDWQAEWISGAIHKSILSDTAWIRHPDAELENIIFTRDLVISKENPAIQAWFDGTADSRFTLFVNRSTVAKSNPEWGQDYTSPFCWVDFAEKLRPGGNTIRCDVSRQNGHGGFIGKFRILLEDGSEVVLRTDESWSAASEGCSGCTTNAKIAARYGDPPWGSPVRRGNAPLLRREFTVKKPVSRARLFVCGLGCSRILINGEKADDSLLNPAYTQYSKRVYYTAHDITARVKQGGNCIGAELGRGYYGCPAEWIGREEAADEPKLLLQLEILYTDGTKERILSGTGWLTTDSATFDDSVWYGEKFNANRAHPGWAKFGYDTIGWFPARQTQAPAGVLQTCSLPPIRISETIPCKLIGKPRPSTYIYDAGKMTAGWAEITVRAPKNTRVKITYGEHLRENGLLDVWKENNDFQFWETPQVDCYICSGTGEEKWEPAFSYKGYRYIQIDCRQEPLHVEAKVLHSAVASTGDFMCSNELFNRIHAMVRNSILNNLHSIPTDTPMHEKRGWTGDGQVIADCASMNFDMHNFFAKWVQDIEDSQNSEGAVSHTCPGTVQYAPSPAWMSALILVPWSLYQFYGDKHILQKHYPAFQKYMTYEIGRLNNYVSSDRYYGDWCTPEGAKGPEGATLFATIYVFHTCRVMEQISKVLRFQPDAQYYANIADKIKDTVNTLFLNVKESSYHTEIPTEYRQSSNVLPLAFGAVPEELLQSVADRLAADVVEKHGNHLSTGCFATKYLAPVLTEYNHCDAAYALANQRTYPSWGYWLDNGATACLEGWDPKKVRSFDHYFLGTIDDWFYEYVAGVRPLEPGYRKILIRPYPDQSVNFAKAELETVHGKVSVEWQKTARVLTLKAALPANTGALVYLPVDRAAVLESGIPAEQAQGVTDKGMKQGCHLYRIESGCYSFTADLSQCKG
ncbi:MAG TPA: family 78 glycoside hydrolase catalytic domain [Caproiciproducens sp.]|nr:family 78 glycoside hydrolase catalytic domain [Caproiciproducens sp.]